MKVAVVTDSACGMSHLNIKMDGLYMIPLQITDGENNYLEGVNLTNDQCYQMMFMGKHMKSSQPSFGHIQELFTQLKAEYDHIYAVPLGKGLSSTINTMELVAREVDIPFTGLDCYSMANIELVCAMTARTLFDQGKSVEEVDRIIRDMAEHSLTLIMAEDLKLFAKNGRTTALAATIGGFLGLVFATLWVVLSKTVWVDVFGNAEAITPFPNPGIFSIPLAFLTIWFFSVTDKSARAVKERDAFTALTVRSQTGIGRSGAQDH